MKKIITVISDTHNKHKQIEKDLPGGDILIHCGDISSVGHFHEIKNFCEWFSAVPNYGLKIFIAGNHDFGFQNYPKEVRELVQNYRNIIYLQDSFAVFDNIKIWGTPWQPWFYDWAFNLPKNGEELKSKWAMIPEDTDILITHCPPFGILDVVIGRQDNLGCELLAERINEVKPKINMFGHIHSGYGLKESNGTTFVNASVLNESYVYTQKPITFDYDF